MIMAALKAAIRWIIRILKGHDGGALLNRELLR